MKYNITLVVEGGNELKNDLQNGHIETWIARDVFSGEKVLKFQYAELPEEVSFEPDDEPHCSYCGSGMFDKKGNCQECGL